MVPGGAGAVIAARYRFVSVYFSAGFPAGALQGRKRNATMKAMHPTSHLASLLALRPSRRLHCLPLLATCAALAAGPVLAQGVPEQGFRIMADGALGNCLACHAMPRQSGVRSTFGPPLDAVGTRYSAELLRQWVIDARRLKPDTLMPPFGTLDGVQSPNRARPMLTDDEVSHVVAALQTLQ
jgi:sulfur-oxidizing protein SoxX